MSRVSEHVCGSWWREAWHFFNGTHSRLYHEDVCDAIDRANAARVELFRKWTWPR